MVESQKTPIIPGKIIKYDGPLRPINLDITEQIKQILEAKREMLQDGNLIKETGEINKVNIEKKNLLIQELMELRDNIALKNFLTKQNELNNIISTLENAEDLSINAINPIVENLETSLNTNIHSENFKDLNELKELMINSLSNNIDEIDVNYNAPKQNSMKATSAPYVDSKNRFIQTLTNILDSENKPDIDLLKKLKEANSLDTLNKEIKKIDLNNLVDKSIAIYFKAKDLFEDLNKQVIRYNDLNNIYNKENKLSKIAGALNAPNIIQSQSYIDKEKQLRITKDKQKEFVDFCTKRNISNTPNIDNIKQEQIKYQLNTEINNAIGGNPSTLEDQWENIEKDLKSKFLFGNEAIDYNSSNQSTCWEGLPISDKSQWIAAINNIGKEYKPSESFKKYKHLFTDTNKGRLNIEDKYENLAGNHAIIRTECPDPEGKSHKTYVRVFFDERNSNTSAMSEHFKGQPIIESPIGCDPDQFYIKTEKIDGKETKTIKGDGMAIVLNNYSGFRVKLNSEGKPQLFYEESKLGKFGYFKEGDLEKKIEEIKETFKDTVFISNGEKYSINQVASDPIPQEINKIKFQIPHLKGVNEGPTVTQTPQKPSTQISSQR